MYSLYANDDDILYGIQKYIVDTEEDMENLPNHTRAGSTAFVIETSTTYILNHSKEWKKIENNTELDNITVDPTYNPESENAQSGVAVAEAVENVEKKIDLLNGSNGENLLNGVTWKMGYLGNATWVNTSQSECLNGESYTDDLIPVTVGETYTFKYEFTPNDNNRVAWWCIQKRNDTSGIERIVLPVTDPIVSDNTLIYTYDFTVPEGVAKLRISGRTNAWNGANGSNELANAMAPKVFSMIVKGSDKDTRLLPEVSEKDNGKHLLVENGKWNLTDNNTDYLYVNNNIKSINHRGFNTIAPENTLSAYRLSKKNGFEYVECDVSFTADGVPVLLHDGTVDRTSNGTGNINSLTFEAVRALDFGSWKSEEYAGEKIPTFEEFIILCKNLGLHPYVEIKNNISVDNATNLVTTVKRCGMQGKVTWISFNKTSLINIKNIDDTARLGFVSEFATTDTITTANELKTDKNEVFLDMAWYSSGLTDEFINQCIENVLPLELWIVNDRDSLVNYDKYITGYTSDNLHANVALYEAFII